MAAAEPLQPVYSIWGDDRAKVERAVHRLEARARQEGALAPEYLDAAAASGSEVAMACESLSFGGLRLVVVRGAEAWRAQDATPLVAYLERPNPATCLALVSAGPLTSKLAEAVGQAGSVLQYGPDPRATRAQRAKWFADHVVAEVRRQGSSIGTSLAREVVSRVGEDAMALSQEAAKLAAYADAAPVTAEAVDAVVVANPEARSYELADAIVARDPGRAYELLADLAGGDRPTDPAVVQSSLVRHFRGVAAAQALGPTARPDDVADATGLRGYPAQKAVEHSRALPAGSGERAVTRLAALELDLRVSTFTDLGRSSEDGRRLVVELATRDLLALTR